MAINWFPGHMHKARKEIKKVMPQMDLIIEVLDARIPFSSENPLVPALRGDTPLIKVLNKRDLADPEARTRLAHEHHRAADLHVFGTPTFRFSTGDTAYVRLKAVPPEGAPAVELFRRVRGMLVDYPYLETLKRFTLEGRVDVTGVQSEVMGVSLSHPLK